MKLPKHIQERNDKAASKIKGYPKGNEITQLKSTGKKISAAGKVFSNGQTGCYDGVYLLDNGQVLEVFLSWHWAPVAALFGSISDYHEYNYLPHHVYFESAFN